MRGMMGEEMSLGHSLWMPRGELNRIKLDRARCGAMQSNRSIQTEPK